MDYLYENYKIIMISEREGERHNNTCSLPVTTLVIHIYKLVCTRSIKLYMNLYIL